MVHLLHRLYGIDAPAEHNPLPWHGVVLRSGCVSPPPVCVGMWVATKYEEKNSLHFPGFSRATDLLFHRLSQQDENVIMTIIKGHSTSTPMPSISVDIYCATVDTPWDLNDPVCHAVNSCFIQISINRFISGTSPYQR